MSKRRGLSLEEKRTRMLDLLMERKDFFLLKELERIAPKEKGIVSQSVKEVVQSLVDDGLADSDKIGTSVYFWAFPSKATSVRKRKLNEAQGKLSDSSKRLKSARSTIAESSEGREESDERADLLRTLADLKKQKSELESEAKKFKDCDPEAIDRMRGEIEASRESSNRWTDNIHSLHSWVQKKFPSVSIADMNKQFGIPADLDYVE